MLGGKQLKNEATKRTLPINRNQSKYKYRLLLIQDDLKKGVNPYCVEQSVPSGEGDLGVQGDDVWPQTKQTGE